MAPSQPSTLVVFGGLPGAGKTAIAKRLASRLGAVYLRIDTIEQTMRLAGITQIDSKGYAVANALAEENLKLGQMVIADCVNPVVESRTAWKAIAERTSSSLVEIEVVCSDPVEHRKRVESRLADIPGHVLPTWAEVMKLQFESWSAPHKILDSAAMPLSELICLAEEYVLAPANRSSMTRFAASRYSRQPRKSLTDDEMIATILRSLRETRKQFAHLYGPKAKRPPKQAPKRAAKARRKASARAKPKRRTA